MTLMHITYTHAQPPKYINNIKLFTYSVQLTFFFRCHKKTSITIDNIKTCLKLSLKLINYLNAHPVQPERNCRVFRADRRCGPVSQVPPATYFRQRLYIRL